MLSAIASTSAKCATSSPVVMSRMTVGVSFVIDRSMSSTGGRPSIDTPPGNDSRIGADGEKPSAMFQPAGSTVSSLKLKGSAPIGIDTRRPVAVVASSTSNTDDGHGVMQWLPPSGLHWAFIGSETSPPHAPKTSTKRVSLLIGADAIKARPHYQRDFADRHA